MSIFWQIIDIGINNGLKKSFINTKLGILWIITLLGKNVDKTVAASTKGLIDAAKSLKIEGQETSKNYPVVVIETDTT